MSSLKTKYYTFEKLVEKRTTIGEDAQIPHLYYTLYERTVTKKTPLILELGTHKGVSTATFLQAVQEIGGHVYSVDIDDQYADLTESKDWTFIHSDSTKVSEIVKSYPALKGGIDILLIDSLHTRTHVEKEFWGWEPYLNKNALIIFDDVDSHIYRPGARKDHIFHEFNWEDIREFVEETFYANEDALFLETHFGSTGFSIMTKRTDRTIRLKQAQKTRKRTNSSLWKTYVKMINFLRKLKSNQ